MANDRMTADDIIELWEDGISFDEAKRIAEEHGLELMMRGRRVLIRPKDDPDGVVRVVNVVGRPPMEAADAAAPDGSMRCELCGEPVDAPDGMAAPMPWLQAGFISEGPMHWPGCTLRWLVARIEALEAKR